MTESKLELVGQYAECGSCWDHGLMIEDFEIQQIQADPRGRWTATGAGRKCPCPNCGMLCELITVRLPVELSDLPCPHCHQSGNYKFALACVGTKDGNFHFTASVTCAKCSTKSVFQRLVASLHRIRGVKLGPVGLDFDTDGGAGRPST